MLLHCYLVINQKTIGNHAKSMFFNAIIQFLMGGILIANAFYDYFSNHLLFESINISQQGNFYIIISFICGNYDIDIYEDNLKYIKSFMVCLKSMH